jgi:hypothetical protein
MSLLATQCALFWCNKQSGIKKPSVAGLLRGSRGGLKKAVGDALSA